MQNKKMYRNLPGSLNNEMYYIEKKCDFLIQKGLLKTLSQ